MEDVHRKDTEKWLHIDLTDEEKLSACKEMAFAVSEKENLENSKKVAMDNFKRQIESEDGRISRNGDLIKNGYREDFVPCQEVISYPEGTYQLWRTDLSVMIEERNLTNDELQMEFPEQVAELQAAAEPVEA